MGTTAEKLAYLDATKTAIKDAIVAKGVDVPEGTEFREYADKIANISTGLSDEELVLANATSEKVLNGYKFYAGNDTLKTGTALSTPTSVNSSNLFDGIKAYDNEGNLITGTALSEETSVTAQKMFAGVKAYNQQGQLITGNPTATTATAADIVSGKTAYNNLGQLMMGSGIGKIISGTMNSKSRVYFNGTIIMAALWCKTNIAGIVFPSETSCAMGNTSRYYGVLRLYDNYIYWDADDTSLSGEYWIIYKD